VPRRPTASARRLRGLLLAALLCASQAGAWLHEAVVSHVTCLEHGESIHAGATPPRAAMPVAERLARLSSQPAAQAATHAHCGAGALLRGRDVVVPAPVATGDLTLPALAPPARERAPRATAGRCLYLVAPKTSPPSARA
jgi:hypothetical protein